MTIIASRDNGAILIGQTIYPITVGVNGLEQCLILRFRYSILWLYFSQDEMTTAAPTCRHTGTWYENRLCKVMLFFFLLLLQLLLFV